MCQYVCEQCFTSLWGHCNCDLVHTALCPQCYESLFELRTPLTAESVYIDLTMEQQFEQLANPKQTLEPRFGSKLHSAQGSAYPSYFHNRSHTLSTETQFAKVFQNCNLGRFGFDSRPNITCQRELDTDHNKWSQLDRANSRYAPTSEEETEEESF